jgi:hypothetical protein
MTLHEKLTPGVKAIELEEEGTLEEAEKTRQQIPGSPRDLSPKTPSTAQRKCNEEF